ncbi:MAG: CPBP family intramembrane metalloprotease [Cyclobacteriaceae bacterium]|nr:CPBP family intramembrane metalloprotease [Cyclobacteriaceae bacterium]
MEKIISKAGHISIPVVIGSGGLLSMWLIAYLLQNGMLPLWVISQHKIVNFTLTMQIMVLPISFIALALLYIYNRESFKKFFRIAIDKENNWNFYGPIMAVAFTIGTLLLMSVDVMSQNGSINNSFFAMMPLVLFVSATNAWSEEIFSRFVIVAGLDGKLKPVTICWISGVIFGIPHYFFGTPSGLFGVVMSGMLGWLLAKSVIETRGLGWALFIHFLQDVVIFGSGAMIIAGH